MKLIIEDEEGRKSVFPFAREEISIGRQEGNTIRLTERNVSRKHARLVRSNGAVVVEDLGSFNGVKVNGDRIDGKLSIHEGDLVEIGDYDLAIENEVQDAPSTSAAAPSSRASGRAPTDPTPGPVSGRATTLIDPAPLGAGVPTSPRTSLADDEGEDAPANKHEATAIIRVQNLPGATQEVVDLPPSKRPRLFLLSTEQAGREITIERSELRIGRTTGDNDLALNHRSISRNHAKLLRNPDGSWHILDLQSANGVSVNGESYADARVASGDLIELGHVKVRFVGPGESYLFSPEDEAEDEVAHAGLASKFPVGLVAGVGLGLLGVLVAVFALQPGKHAKLATPSPAHSTAARPAIATAAPPPSAARPILPEVPAPRPVVAAAPAPRPEPVAAAPRPPPPPPPSAAPSRAAIHKHVAELVSEGKAALREHHLTVAEEKLHAAQQLAASDPGVARLRKEVQAAREKAARAERTHSRRPAAAAQPHPTTSKADRRERAMQVYEGAIGLVNGGDYDSALTRLIQVLEIDPSLADAHKAMGICYAKLHQPAKGAAQYEQYLRLKPNAPDAAAVRRMLADYSRTK